MAKITINESIYSQNDKLARKNKKLLRKIGLVAVNLMASPGAGKTALLLAILKALPKKYSSFVIEGDVASSVDTKKIRESGFQALQINTGGGCHLTSKMISDVLPKIKIKGPGFVFIENIGNLICPAEFELGESIKLVESSVPEGDDKPIKYPGIFKYADIIVLNKIDLLPYLKFDLKAFERGVRAVNSTAPIIKISAVSGEGVGEVVNAVISIMGRQMRE